MPNPIALMSSAAQATPRDPDQAEESKGRPKMHKAQLSVYDPTASPTGSGDPGNKRDGLYLPELEMKKSTDEGAFDFVVSV